MALMIVLTLCVLYKSDYVGVEITELVLKNNLDNAAVGATMLIEEERYGDGYILFKDAEVREYVSKILDDKCDEYVIHIFDSSGKHRQYDSYGLVNEESVSFPHFYTDLSGKDISVNSSSIIIEGKIEKEFYRFSELKSKKTEVMRSTMYVVDERGV